MPIDLDATAGNLPMMVAWLPRHVDTFGGVAVKR